MSFFDENGSSRRRAFARGSLPAFLLAALLAFTLMAGFGCTPTDDEDEVIETGQSASDESSSGGFVVEDTAVVEVNIAE